MGATLAQSLTIASPTELQIQIGQAREMLQDVASKPTSVTSIYSLLGEMFRKPTTNLSTSHMEIA